MRVTLLGGRLRFSPGSLAKKMEFLLRVLFVAVLPFTTLSSSQGKGLCDLPTSKEVTTVAESLIGSGDPEGAGGQTLNTTQLQFTCLATVALEKYSYASVVINFTTSNASDVFLVRQFQLTCSNSSRWASHPDNEFDRDVSSMPFEIETQFRCAECLETSPGIANYDNVSKCLLCAPQCLDNGGGFCSDRGGDACCPSFDSETGACLEDCTTINRNFVRNESNSVCVCNISCGPGYTQNTNCTCEVTDGCEAAGQPCQKGGNCTSLSTPPYYSCQCVAGTTGQNCSTPTISCKDGCIDGQCGTATGCCAKCSDGYHLDANCHCVPESKPQPQPTADPSGVCPATCLQCEVDDPTCCSSCPEQFVVRTCECVQDEEETSVPVLVLVIIGALVLILLILALSITVVYVIYLKRKLKEQQPRLRFNEGAEIVHHRPVYIQSVGPLPPLEERRGERKKERWGERRRL